MARFNYQWGTIFTSINASNANAAGDECALQQLIPQPESFSWQVGVSGGTYSALNVTLEGSLDGTNWVTVDTSTVVGGDIRPVTGKKYNFLRVKKNSSTTGTGTPVITATILA